MNEKDNRELDLDQLDTVNGGLAQSANSVLSSSSDRLRVERDMFDRFLKTINSLMHAGGRIK